MRLRVGRSMLAIGIALLPGCKDRHEAPDAGPPSPTCNAELTPYSKEAGNCSVSETVCTEGRCAGIGHLLFCGTTETYCGKRFTCDCGAVPSSSPRPADIAAPR